MEGSLDANFYGSCGKKEQGTFPHEQKLRSLIRFESNRRTNWPPEVGFNPGMALQTSATVVDAPKTDHIPTYIVLDRAFRIFERVVQTQLI